MVNEARTGQRQVISVFTVTFRELITSNRTQVPAGNRLWVITEYVLKGAHRGVSKLNALGFCVADEKGDMRDVIPFVVRPVPSVNTRGIAVHSIHFKPETNLMV